MFHRVRKGYKCHCGKSYKTAQGLKNHALHTHNSQPDSVLNAQLANALAIGDGASASTTPVGSNNTSSNPNPPPVIQRSNSPSQSLGSLSPSSISNMSSSASSCHGGSSSLSNGNNNGNNGGNTTSNTAILTGNTNVLQQLSAGNVVTLTNLPNQQQQQQQQQQAQQLHQNTATGNSNNNLMRSTLGLVSIKANNTPTAKSVSNLMAANATASKILKLATNVANGGASMDIVQQQQHQQQQHNKTANGQTVLNGSKPLPNLVNLGILTPATSPTKNTQTLTFTTTNGSSQQQQALVASLAKKTNILLLQEPNQLLQQVQQQQQQHQQQQQQVQQQHHVLPISPTSSISGNSSKSSSPTPQQQQQQQLVKKGKLELLESMDTDEGQSDGISESVAAAIASITDCKEDMSGATVAGIEVVGAGAVNEET